MYYVAIINIYCMNHFLLITFYIVLGGFKLFFDFFLRSMSLSSYILLSSWVERGTQTQQETETNRDGRTDSHVDSTDHHKLHFMLSTWQNKINGWASCLVAPTTK